MNNWKSILFNSSTSLIIIGFVSLFLIFRLSWKMNEGETYQTITSDGIGYYQYLPNFFLKNSIQDQQPDNRFFNEINEKGVNKYFVGTAVSIYPFFQIASWIEKDKEVISGYESGFQRAISFAGFFYLLGGLIFLRLLLRKYEFDEIIISITLLVFFFGSNLLAYSVLFPSMSHVYSFFFISGFLFFIQSFSESKNLKSILWAALFLGMIILIRPLNGIIVFAIPFVIGSKKVLIDTLKSAFKPVIIVSGILIICAILFIQSYLWHLQCGEWIVWSYSGEGFYFSKPFFREFLFSFRKGAFIYTPILILSVFGIALRYKQNKFQGVSALLFSILLIYVLSAWWNWYYGPSFGQRPLVEFYPVFGLMIAFFINSLSRKCTKISVGFVVVGFVFLNMIQTYQYHKGILSWWDMNWSKYSFTFLKTKDIYRDCLGGNNDIMLYNPQVDTVFSKHLTPLSEENGLEIGNSIWSSLDKKEVVDYTNREFNYKVTIPVKNDFVSKRGVYILAKLNRKELVSSNKNSALFVIDISDSTGNNYYYGRFPVSSVPPTITGKWIPQEYSIEIKEIRNSSDIIRIYIWNKEKQSFWIDGVDLKILAID